MLFCGKTGKFSSCKGQMIFKMLVLRFRSTIFIRNNDAVVQKTTSANVKQFQSIPFFLERQRYLMANRYLKREEKFDFESKSFTCLLKIILTGERR